MRSTIDRNANFANNNSGCAGDSLSLFDCGRNNRVCTTKDFPDVFGYLLFHKASVKTYHSSLTSSPWSSMTILLLAWPSLRPIVWIPLSISSGLVFSGKRGVFSRVGF